jgi:uncharacterized protein YndB with AHSA1/START domain
MRFRPLVILSTACLLGGPAFAGQSLPKPNGGQERSTSAESMAKTQSFEGKVKALDPGKKLVLQMADHRTKTFWLDKKNLVLNVESSVAVGTEVKVTVTKNADGTAKLSVEPESKS